MDSYYDSDGIIRHTTKDSTIEGKDGDIVQIGDTVQYMNNPFCKPEEVVDFFQDTIVCSGGRGEAIHYKLIRKRQPNYHTIRIKLK